MWIWLISMRAFSARSEGCGPIWQPCATHALLTNFLASTHKSSATISLNTHHFPSISPAWRKKCCGQRVIISYLYIFLLLPLGWFIVNTFCLSTSIASITASVTFELWNCPTSSSTWIFFPVKLVNFNQCVTSIVGNGFDTLSLLHFYPSTSAETRSRALW